MYPSRFAYDAPASVAEAVAILDRSNGEAKVLAGGQSLIPMLKLRFASPERIVDINNVPGLDYLRQDPDGTLHIGALVRHEDDRRCDALLGAVPADRLAASDVIHAISGHQRCAARRGTCRPPRGR